MLYGTSKRFLEVFGLKALKDLPELRELDQLAKEPGIGGGGGAEVSITAVGQVCNLSREAISVG